MPETDISAQLAQEMGIPIGANPMKPGDVMVHPSFTKLPPKCPVCKTLLYPSQQDMTSGNLLFECLNGNMVQAGHYMAVYRVATQSWGERPGAERDGWQPPLLTAADAVEPVAPKRKARRRVTRKGAGVAQNG